MNELAKHAISMIRELNISMFKPYIFVVNLLPGTDYGEFYI